VALRPGPAKDRDTGVGSTSQPPGTTGRPATPSRPTDVSEGFVLFPSCCRKHASLCAHLSLLCTHVIYATAYHHGSRTNARTVHQVCPSDVLRGSPLLALSRLRVRATTGSPNLLTAAHSPLVYFSHGGGPCFYFDKADMPMFADMDKVSSRVWDSTRGVGTEQQGPAQTAWPAAHLAARPARAQSIGLGWP
jgi:hypothetical protein